MTVTQIAALRAANDAGVPVTKKVIDDAFEYVRTSQNLTHEDLYGGFAYQKGHPERVSYALTAAALSTIFGLGRYGDKPGDARIIEDGMRFMDRKFDSEYRSTHEQWYYYRLFYAVTSPLYPVLRRVAPKFVTSNETIGRAMLTVARVGAPKRVLETVDINLM